MCSVRLFTCLPVARHTRKLSFIAHIFLWHVAVPGRGSKSRVELLPSLNGKEKGWPLTATVHFSTLNSLKRIEKADPPLSNEVEIN